MPKMRGRLVRVCAEAHVALNKNAGAKKKQIPRFARDDMFHTRESNGRAERLEVADGLGMGGTAGFDFANFVHSGA